MVDEVSIVIPTLNEEKFISKLLTSLSKQEYKGKMEVIVVDGNSSDKTIEVAKQFSDRLPHLSILALKKRGISYQRNRGADKARYNYLLFLDADMILPKHFLINFFAKVRVDRQFVMSANVWVAERDILSYIAFAIMYPLFYVILQKEKVLAGFLLFTTKENHKKIGGFREDLPMVEDVDYGWRSIASGAKYHFCFTPVALHSARRMRKRGRIKFFYDYLRGYYLIKTQGFEKAIQQINYPFGEYN